MEKYNILTSLRTVVSFDEDYKLLQDLVAVERSFSVLENGTVEDIIRVGLHLGADHPYFSAMVARLREKLPESDVILLLPRVQEGSLEFDIIFQVVSHSFEAFALAINVLQGGHWLRTTSKREIESLYGRRVSQVETSATTSVLGKVENSPAAPDEVSHSSSKPSPPNAWTRPELYAVPILMILFLWTQFYSNSKGEERMEQVLKMLETIESGSLNQKVIIQIPLLIVDQTEKENIGTDELIPDEIRVFKGGVAEE